LFFLFFLSLIPIFTKWVIENPGALIPAVGYDLVYILVSFCSVFIFHSVIRTRSREEVRAMREQRRQAKERAKEQAPPGALWERFTVTAAAVAAIIAVSLAVPAVSTVFLLGVPVVFLVANLLSDGFSFHRGPRGEKRGGEPEETPDTSAPDTENPGG